LVYTVEHFLFSSELAVVNVCCYLLGIQSIYVKTWGCSHNNSDSEYMAGQLAAYGYTITGSDNSVMFAIDLLHSVNI